MNKDYVRFLLERPVEFAHLLGFTKLTELHNDWIKDMVVGSGDKTLQAHRGSYKTTCVTIALPIIMLLFPNDRVLFERKTDNDVKEVITQVGHILQSDVYKAIAQEIYGRSIEIITLSTKEITINTVSDLKGSAQLIGLGTGGSLTGKHFDRIFTDDIVNLQDRLYKAERDRTKSIYQELQNLRNRGGRIFNTGTPWHQEDCFTLMPNIVQYDCYTTSIMTAEEIEAVKASMLPSLFAANYELRHIASEDIIFTNPKTDGDPAFVEQGIVHIDCAYDGEDWTAFTICQRKDGKYYVFGKCWRKNCIDLEDEMVRYVNAFNAGRIYNEDNADKGFFAKDLRKKGMRVSLYHESMNKFVKITSYLKAEWENVIFVKGTDKEYIDQICDFNENAEHDDCPDSLASIMRIYSKKKDSEPYTPLWSM